MKAAKAQKFSPEDIQEMQQFITDMGPDTATGMDGSVLACNLHGFERIGHMSPTRFRRCAETALRENTTESHLKLVTSRKHT